MKHLWFISLDLSSQTKIKGKHSRNLAYSLVFVLRCNACLHSRIAKSLVNILLQDIRAIFMEETALSTFDQLSVSSVRNLYGFHFFRKVIYLVGSEAHFLRTFSFIHLLFEESRSVLRYISERIVVLLVSAFKLERSILACSYHRNFIFLH